ncbi:hypothetical protein [Streptosporangium sp. H16]|uniref:hypothetical protein n=1 Tax=Streptosporangium sp. H16 TaxID=3444184 RepID=UPI003F7B32FD
MPVSTYYGWRERAARLSPLGHAHLNVLGRYAISSSAPAEGLRRLGEIPDLPDGGDTVETVTVETVTVETVTVETVEGEGV